MRIFVAGSLLVGIAFNAAAVQTTVPMRECVNCTAAQMQTMAKNSPPGFVFVYDLAHNAIRKYEVYMDSTCDVDPAIQGIDGIETSREIARRPANASIDCGSFKAADEVMPVDPDVQAIFNALHSAWSVNPQLVNASTDHIADFPIEGNHYDAAKIAWDYPQGDYVAFRNYLWQHVLDSRADANAFSPGLGDLIFGVDIAINSVTIGTPPDVIQVHITIDRNLALVHLEVCNVYVDCTKFDLKVANGQVDSLTYEGTFDSNNMMFPSESGQAPGQLGSWHWNHAGDADRFASGLRNNAGINVPARPTCGGGDWKLVVARVNGVVDSVSWQCMPHN